MGNYSFNSCCLKEDWCFINRGREKLFIDVKIIETYPTRIIVKIQSCVRSFITRKFIKYSINQQNSSSNYDYNKEQTSKSQNQYSKKVKKIKYTSKITPEAFAENRRPGKLLDDAFFENFKGVALKVLETENMLGSFIIEEKEICKFIDEYKYKLKKYSLEYETGEVYIGYLDPNWHREGYGIYILKDGSKFEGTFCQNKMSGRGRLIGFRGDYYEGDFENDKANGFGKYVNKDGGIYVGYWADEKQDGKGEEIFIDGSRYEGFYVNGLKHGKGKFIWIDGSVYEGDFTNNNIDGYGIYKWRDGRLYQGDWKLNKMEGSGFFLWPDKKKYIGEYKDDKKDGYGIFMWPGGKKYEGQWYNGKQHGYGTLTFSGVKKFGQWREGIKMKWITNGEYAEELNSIEEEIRKISENLNLGTILSKFHADSSSNSSSIR